MKKILVIDDRIAEWKEEGYVKHVVFSDTTEGYLDFDKAGNYCHFLFDETDFDFIFIHHSQMGKDSLMPPPAIDLIKEQIGGRLVLFSGAIEEHMLNQDRPPFIYRSIQRGNLLKNFAEFIKRSLIVEEWLIEMFFLNYAQKLANAIKLMPDRDIEDSEIKKSKEMRQLLLIKEVITGSSKYNEVMGLQGEELFEVLKKL